MPVMRLVRQLLVIFFLWFLPIGKEYRNNSFTVITHVLPAFQRCIQIYLLFILRREITMRKLIAWSIKLSEKVHFGILLFYDWHGARNNSNDNLTFIDCDQANCSIDFRLYLHWSYVSFEINSGIIRLICDLHQ